LKRLAFALALLFIGGSSAAQTLSGVRDIAQYRPQGEIRSYTFIAEEKEIGRLETEIVDSRRVNGRPIYTVREQLNIDLSGLSLGFRFDVSQKSTIDEFGRLREAEATVRMDEREEDIRVHVDTDSGLVVYDRGEDGPAARTITIDEPVFAADDFMLDQLELMLAVHDLIPGRVIIVPTVSVRSMYATEFEFQVVGRTQIQYGAFTDSVWQVNTVRPSRAVLYIDRQHLLVKYIDVDKKLSAELKRDPFAERPGPSRSIAERIDDQMERAPIYGFFLLVSAIWLIFLGRDGFANRRAYLLFAVGMLVYPIILFTQAPLQKAYGANVLAPALGRGSSIFSLAILPSLITGIIQQTLKFIPLLLVARYARVKPWHMISLGAFIGAGFGFAEACHAAGPLFQARQLLTISLFDRIFAILLHAVLGAAIAHGIAIGRSWQFWLAAIFVHGFTIYLGIFVQVRIFSLGVLQGILIVFDFILLAIMMTVQIMFKRQHTTGKKGRR